jgi:DNA-binding transcriptional regulator YiaG
MNNVLFTDLGLPVLLVDPPMTEANGQQVPDINMQALQDAVFQMLIGSRTRLTGDQIRFIRKHVRWRQADFAELLNMANHSIVSHWESRQDEFSGMDYNTEVLLRIWMAVRAGQSANVTDLLEHTLKNLQPSTHEPLAVDCHNRHRGSMDPAKQARLEAAGWRVGSADEFLGVAHVQSERVEVLPGWTPDGNGGSLPNTAPSGQLDDDADAARPSDLLGTGRTGS